jgi:hypothetical protein
VVGLVSGTETHPNQTHFGQTLELSLVGAAQHTLCDPFGRPFGRLVNSSLDEACQQGRVSSPWRLREPSISGLVSFQGT